MGEAPAPTVGATFEITLRCNLHCIHCGSRAREARQRELTTEEALSVVEQFAEVGVTEVNLIGGEAYLRQDWDTIARAVVAAGMHCGMTTGGWGVTRRLAERIAASGIASISVSVDGTEATHDALRGRDGSWRWCFEALANLRSVGYVPNANTQLNRWSIPELPQIYLDLHEAGIGGWQVQFTGPMGRAADRPDLIVQPAELPVAHDVLARVAAKAWADGIVVGPALNVGYFGPHERAIRGDGAPWAFWQGPDQGLRTLGVESDGTVKAEGTLPTAVYAAGNVLDRPIAALLDEPIMGYAAALTVDGLRGFCATCEYAAVCLGGDPWMAHLLTGAVGDNPFCDHRARTLAAGGRRERIALVEAAPGSPYDMGVYQTVEEPLDAPWPAGAPAPLTADSVVWPAAWVDAAPGPPAARAVGRDVERVPPTGRPLPRPRPGSSVRRVGQLVEIKRRLDRRDAAR